MFQLSLQSASVVASDSVQAMKRKRGWAGARRKYSSSLVSHGSSVSEQGHIGVILSHRSGCSAQHQSVWGQINKKKEEVVVKVTYCPRKNEQHAFPTSSLHFMSSGCYQGQSESLEAFGIPLTFKVNKGVFVSRTAMEDESQSSCKFERVRDCGSLMRREGTLESVDES